MLIISSDTEPVYSEHRKIWSSYMNSNSQIECYFIQYRDGPQEIEGNIFWLNGKESFPAILPKTLDSIKFFLQKDSYDFIVRTNMSSLWNFSGLVHHLQSLPTEKVYNGIIGNHQGIPFISGAGIIMSADVGRLLIQNREIAESVKIIDDVDIGSALHNIGIIASSGMRTDFFSTEVYDAYEYDPSSYHYRFKWNNYSLRCEEAECMQKLLAKFNIESFTN